MLASTMTETLRDPRQTLGKPVGELNLRIHGGPHDGQQLRIAAAKCSIGGAPGCTLRLRGVAAEALYCWILRGPEGTIVRRYSSEVLLNQRSFDEAVLCDGDRLRIGPMELEIVSGTTGPGESFTPQTPVALRNQPPATPDVNPFKQAFTTRSAGESLQRRSVRKHQRRRVRRLLSLLRKQSCELDSLRQQPAAPAPILPPVTAPETPHADLDRLAAERAELEATCRQLEAELADRNAQLARHASEAEENHRSTAAQIDEMTRAFALMRQERDELAAKLQQNTTEWSAERNQLEAEVAQLNTEADERRTHAHAEHQEAVAQLEQLIGQLQNERDALAAQDAEHQRAAQATRDELDEMKAELARVRQEPQDEIAALRTELNERTAELEQTRSAAEEHKQHLVKTVDMLRDEISQLQHDRGAQRKEWSAARKQLEQRLEETEAALRKDRDELASIRQHSVEKVSAAQLLAKQAEHELARQKKGYDRERKEWQSARTRLERDLTTVQDQLKHRTADWEASQKQVAEESKRFSETVDQLRGELHHEREAHREVVEARRIEQKQHADDLAALKHQLDQARRASEDTRRLSTHQIEQVTASLEMARRQAIDAEAALERERSEWQHERNRIEQGASELLSECRVLRDRLETASRSDVATSKATEEKLLSAEQRAMHLALEMETVQQQLASAQEELTTVQSQLAEQQTALETAEQTWREKWLAGDQQVEQWQGEAHRRQLRVEELEQQLQQELAGKAALQTQSDEQIQQTAELAEQSRRQAEELEQLRAANEELARQLELARQTPVAEPAPTPAPEHDAEEIARQIEQIHAAHEQLGLVEQQLQQERATWETYRVEWEAALQEKESQLAQQAAELQQQVEQWQAAAAAQAEQLAAQQQSLVAAAQPVAGDEPTEDQHFELTSELPPESLPEPMSDVPSQRYDDTYQSTANELNPELLNFAGENVEVAAETSETHEPVEPQFMTQPMSAAQFDDAPSDAARSDDASGDIRHSDEVRFAAKFGNLYGPLGCAGDEEVSPADAPQPDCTMPVTPADLQAAALESEWSAAAPEQFESQPIASEQSEAEAPPSNPNAAFLLDREPEQDPDSVTSVLSRLMQAGIWHEEDGAKPSLDLPELDPPAQLSADETPAAAQAYSAESSPGETSEPVNHAHEQPEEMVGEEEAIPCRTMDVSELMGERQAPRSWRAELLGEDAQVPETQEELPSNEGFHTQVLSHDELQQNGLLGPDGPSNGWQNQLLGNDQDGRASVEEPAEAAVESETTNATGPSATDDSEYSLQDSQFRAAAPAAPPQEPAAASGDDEESIEAYMSRLLQRVRGDSADEAPKFVMPTAIPTQEPVAARPASPAPVAPPPASDEPVDPETFLPRSHAPEMNSNLAAMRELANSAAKSAITTHAKRRQGQKIANRLVYSSMALFTTGGLAVWALYFDGGRIAWTGAGIGGLLISFWTLQSVASVFKMLQLKQQQLPAAANQEEPQSADAEAND